MPGSSGRLVAPARAVPTTDLEEVVTPRAAMFERLRGSRIFMTGGTGFVGRWLLETLLWADNRLDLKVRVEVLTRDPEGFGRSSPHLATASAVTLVPGDVRTFDFPSGTFDRVIHLAAETNVQLRNPAPEAYFDVIVEGTRRVLDFIEDKAAKDLLFVSSGAVYGPQPSSVERLYEDDPYGPVPTRPGAAYGEAKRCAEMLVCARAERTAVAATIGRCFAFVGPYLPLDSGFAIGNFINDALAGRDIVVQGDGSPRRTYMYASDMATWLWTIALGGRSGWAYNVGSDEVVTIADVAHLIAESAGHGSRVRIMGDPIRVGVGNSYVPDLSRARSELGLTINVDLEEAIRRTVTWHKGRLRTVRARARR